MAKKNKKEELLDEKINTEVTEQATEAVVKAIEPSKKQAEVEVQHTDTKLD